MAMPSYLDRIEEHETIDESEDGLEKLNNRYVVETPLISGDFEGKALYLSTRGTSAAKKDESASAATTRRRSRAKSLHPIPRTPSPFDPTADFTFESQAVSPDIPEDRIAALKDCYKRSCRSTKVTQCSSFLKQLGSTSLALRELKLSRNEFKAILSTLVNDTELIHVDLAGNPATAREAGYIGELLKANKYITQLTLSEMNLTGNGMASLAKTIKSCMGLVRVDLSSNFLCDKDGDSICSIIDDTDGIRELILHHNQLGDCGVKLGRSIADNVTLYMLDLSWNHIRGQGAVGIARGLQRNQHLTTVKLAWNGFGFEGCVAMGHALRSNTCIQALDLTSNRIHLPALHKLTDGLVRNKVLTKLVLSLNPIPSHCTSYLLSRIQKWKHSGLKELDLQGTVVDKQFGQLLKEIQEERLFIVRYDKALPLQKGSMASATIDPANIYNIDPVRILFFMKQNLRTIDLFLKIDKDTSGSLSKEEMKYAFELEGYPVSDMALDQVMSYLDTDKDGAVDLREFFEGERRSRRDHRKDNDESIEESTNATPNLLNPHINMVKYSQAFRKPNSNKSPAALSPRRSNTFV